MRSQAQEDSLPSLLSRFTESKGLEWSKVVEEGTRLGLRPVEYLVKIAKADYMEILGFFKEHLKEKYGIEAQVRLNGNVLHAKGWYVEFEDGSLGVWNSEDYISLVNSPLGQGKEVYLVPFSFFELREIEESDPVRSKFFSLLLHAERLRATDIHFEVKPSSVEIKFRIFGNLVKFSDLSHQEWALLLKVIKTMASEWTARFSTEEWRETQDARVIIPERKLDLRLAFTPSLKDRLQNLVVRILSQSVLKIRGIEDVVGLGYSRDDAEKFIQYFKANRGLILITGATGTGKSKTLNTLLALVPPERKILTVEDPVEYLLDNAVQHQVMEFEREGEVVVVGFLEFLREFMRQDPDVILVGEWRRQDDLTKAVLYASETGHLVATTLHTSRVINAPNLLVSQYGLHREDLVNNCLLIINQRLVRKVCPHCKVEREIKEEDLIGYEYVRMNDKEKLLELIGTKGSFPKDGGCDKCRISNPLTGEVMSAGYSGRTALYEYLELIPDVQDLLLKTTSALDIENLFISLSGKGGKTYIDTAIEKVKSGQVCIHDIMEALR